MATKHYSDLYIIDDIFRKRKYEKLILTSLISDLHKWTSKILIDGKNRYKSPAYGDSYFIIDSINWNIIAYVYNKNPPISRNTELIADNSDISNELKTAIETLRNTIYTPELQEIEKLVGSIKNSRKEKLEHIVLELIKEIIDDTFQDWLKNSSEISAKLIAKLIHAYRTNDDAYKLWLEKFKNSELVNNELKNIQG